MAGLLSSSLQIILLVLVAIAVPLVLYAVYKLILEERLKRRGERQNPPVPPGTATGGITPPPPPATGTQALPEEQTNVYGAPPASTAPRPPSYAPPQPAGGDEETEITPLTGSAPTPLQSGQPAMPPPSPDETMVAPVAAGPAEPRQGKVCPRCGTVNAADAKYCRKCGTPLP